MDHSPHPHPAFSSPPPFHLPLPDPVNSPSQPFQLANQPTHSSSILSPPPIPPISPPILLPPTPPSSHSPRSNFSMPLNSPNELPFHFDYPLTEENHFLLDAFLTRERSRLRRGLPPSRLSLPLPPNSTQRPPTNSVSASTPDQPSSLVPASSLGRRLLAVARFAADSDRHASVERMNDDLEAGGDRSQAVNRLRQRMNDLRPDHLPLPHLHHHHHHHHHHHQAQHHQHQHQHSAEPDFGTRNLVGTLHQVRSQRHRYPKFGSRNTYLLYCGSHTHVGCGQLLTARATPLTATRLGATDEGGGEGELLASDSLPVPGAVDRVDSHTQASLERDLGDTRSQCRCERRFLGCLSCGNTVGHSVSLRCQHCRDEVAVFRYRYHLASLTALPRHMGMPVALTLAAVSPSRPVQPVMSWTEALGAHMDDWDAGLVGTARDQPGVASLGTVRRGFSTAVRSAIARGMTTDGGPSLAHERHARLNRSDAMRVSMRRTRLRGSSIPDVRHVSPPLMLREYVTGLERAPADESRRMSVEVKEEEEEEEGLMAVGSALGRRRMNEDEDEEDEDELVGGGRRMRRRIEEGGGDDGQTGGGERSSRFVWRGEVCAR